VHFVENFHLPIGNEDLIFIQSFLHKQIDMVLYAEME